MHVCFVNLIIEYYSPVSGGALATCIMQQAKRLIARGHRVSVLTPVNGDPMYEVGEVVPLAAKQRHELSVPTRIVSKVRNRVSRWDWPYYEFYLNSALDALRRLSPDVVICTNDLRLPRYVRRALPDAKIAAYLHNEIQTRQANQAEMAACLDLVFCVSSYIRDWVLRTYPIAPKRAIAVLNGADLDAFYPRADYRHSRRPLKVLFIGRMNPEKGPDIAAQAVGQLRREGLEVELTMAGSKWWYGNHDDDPYLVELKRELTAVGANYLGHVTRDQVPELVREHDVVMLPARWNDPCPLVQFEALASGCAVIASRRGGIPEVCGDAAILCDPDHPEQFTDALRSLVVDPARLLDYRRRGLARAAELSWDHNVDTLERTLQAAVAPAAATTMPQVVMS
jgi:glycosyltransferase involved in cell wall biosynthesis